MVALNPALSSPRVDAHVPCTPSAPPCRIHSVLLVLEAAAGDDAETCSSSTDAGEMMLAAAAAAPPSRSLIFFGSLIKESHCATWHLPLGGARRGVAAELSVLCLCSLPVVLCWCGGRMHTRLRAGLAAGVLRARTTAIHTLSPLSLIHLSSLADSGLCVFEPRRAPPRQK